MAATPMAVEGKNQLEDGARIKLEPSWRMRLKDEFASEPMARLREFLEGQYAKGKTIFPKRSEFFAALDATPFDQVKVVILGQDPYHGPGQAHGLCFSVREGTPHPPSLQNILKEVSTDLGVPLRKSGSLAAWARQGVLLLNATLTVEAGAAGSHQGKGWEWFTDRIVDLLNREREHLVFILWGAYAQKKGQYIDRRRHLVLEAPHPSPLSAHRGFFGSRPFSATNRYLKQHGIQPIDWRAE